MVSCIRDVFNRKSTCISKWPSLHPVFNKGVPFYIINRGELRNEAGGGAKAGYLRREGGGAKGANLAEFVLPPPPLELVCPAPRLQKCLKGDVAS